VTPGIFPNDNSKIAILKEEDDLTSDSEKLKQANGIISHRI
jgi:hypothetical protein